MTYAGQKLRDKRIERSVKRAKARTGIRPSNATRATAALITTKIGKALRLNNEQSKQVYDIALDILARGRT